MIANLLALYGLQKMEYSALSLACQIILIAVSVAYFNYAQVLHRILTPLHHTVRLAMCLYTSIRNIFMVTFMNSLMHVQTVDTMQVLLLLGEDLGMRLLMFRPSYMCR